MRNNFQCTRDGLTIRGFEYREKEGPLPALILSHGYLANQSMCTGYAQLAAALGYAAFTFDFNGGGLKSMSDGKSENMTVLTEVTDLKAVIAAVRQLPDIDTEHIILLGCSQGGVVSAITAKDPEYRPEKLVLLYPALCIPDDARAGHMMFARFDPDNPPTLLQRLPMKLGRDYALCVRNWQLEDMVGGYFGPVLYLHGTADRIVNIRYARAAEKLYPRVEYHEIIDGEHMFQGKHDEEAKYFIRRFLTQNPENP